MTDREVIKITVKGRSGSGKTTVAAILAKALREAGIECQVKEGVNMHYDKLLQEQWLPVRIRSLAERNTFVSIREQATLRSLKP